MKSFTFLICTFLLSSNVSKAQTHSISYYEISVMSLSVSISYSGSSYSSPYFSDAYALNTLQKRFDYYHGMVSNEWGRLEKFDLLNASNKITLNNHKITIRNYFAQNNNFTQVDWAQNGQFAVEIVNYVSDIYNNSNIKNEISLLQSCQTELSRIKNKDPDNYLFSKRYQSIMKTLEKLKNCSTSEIQGLSWERSEIENQNNGITTYNNNSSNNSYSFTIIGKPIRIGRIEVAQYDFPKAMNWNDAKKACEELGSGWKLPTKDELNLMYLNKDKIGGFDLHSDGYWNSTEVDNLNAQYVHFYNGILITDFKDKNHYVRAVKTSSASIIGKPIRIGRIEVAQYDFPKRMLWNDAVNACADLGNGWRLPTKYELNLMYLNKGKIGGFANLDYWSSTEFDSNRACFQYLGSDGSGYQGDHDKSDSQSVRAVRSF